MARAPAVSVVIPTKDRPAMAAAAVASACAQEDTTVEIIVVDDGSAPAAARRLRELVERRATVVRHESSLGVSAARNAGIARAAAPWLAFLDDDDLWAPGKLAAQLAAAEGGAKLVCTTSVVVDEHRRVVGRNRVHGGPGALAQLLRANSVGTPSSVMADTALVREVGGFDPAFSILADWDLWLRLAERAPVAACHAALTAYTEHAGSMSLTRQDELRGELARLEAKHRRLLDRHGERLGGATLERWIAVGVRRGGRPWRAARAYLGIAARHRDAGALARGVLLLVGPAPLAVVRRARARWTAARGADEFAWLAHAPRAADF